MASSWLESAITCVAGEASRIARAAAGPPPGMRTSTSAMSGWNSAAATHAAPRASSARRDDLELVRLSEHGVQQVAHQHVVVRHQNGDALCP